MTAGATPEEQDRMLGELIRLGRVVDVAGRLCVVELGDEDEGLRTGPIPWAAARAGETRIWIPPSIGEQVTVLLPEGDIERAQVIGSVYSDDIEPPAVAGAAVIAFNDGAVISYDPAAHLLTITLPGGAVAVTAPQGVAITGPVTIEGEVAVTGQVTATVDVLAAGKSLKSHRHGEVAAGAAQTGLPV